MRSRFSTSLLIVFILTLGVCLGVGSAYLAVRKDFPFGSVKAGAWTYWPKAGARDIDPYMRAVLARTGGMPLGIGEGLSLRAQIDDSGQKLRSRCSYALSGVAPSARFWTLSVEPAYEAAPERRNYLSSAEILRNIDNSFTIHVGPEAMPGNWILSPASRDIEIVFRLYDTPAISSGLFIDPKTLPKVERLTC